MHNRNPRLYRKYHMALINDSTHANAHTHKLLPAHTPFCRRLLCAAVGLDDVFDCPPTDRAAGVGHLLELEAAGVAQAHVSAGVQHSVHHVLVADSALVAPRA